MKKLLSYLLILFCCCCSKGYAQIGSNSLKELITSEGNFKTIRLENAPEVLRLYELLNFQPMWMNKDCEGRRARLLENFDSAANWGLEKNEYNNSYIQTILRYPVVVKSAQDSLTAELKITDAAIRFFSHIHGGDGNPGFSYDGLKEMPLKELVVESMAKFLKEGSFFSLISQLEPQAKEYKNAITLIRLYNEVLQDSLYREVKITNKNVNTQNLLLVIKLKQLGFISKVDSLLTDKAVFEGLQKAQKTFGLMNDGILRNTVLAELNVPIANRQAELLSMLNAIRWINAFKAKAPLVVVNLPSATLFYFEDGMIKLDSRLVVGKKTTPSSTLASTITEVVLYPYWNVPRSIATKELLPLIKKNINYLDQNNFQVLNERGTVLDPRKVPWSTLTPSNFPYFLRQSTGCDNSLGLIKLNFVNPFGIYLHDTPSKGLFHLNKRYFSHGCMRVEKALELSKLLVSEKGSYIDSIVKKGCLFNQPPISLKLQEPVTVAVVYNTAWFDASGNISFSEDVYNRNKPVKKTGLFAAK